MDTRQIMSAFTEFFSGLGHTEIPGASLVPPPGDRLLFTSAGMQPLTPYLLGQPHPAGRRLTGIQRCLRTTDLEEVGDCSHLTMFQMLGSWSLGDYDGPQSLRFGLDLLCGRLGIRQELLHATVFGGDGQVGPDTAGLETWTGLGLPVELLGPEDNWWSNGPTGPCGPDSEVFVWTGDGPPAGSPSSDSRWVELWNHVSMRYLRHPDGSLTPLSQPSVDTGMGLERLVMACQGVRSVFETDVFSAWLSVLPQLWSLDQRSLRILADHLRSSVVVIGDGVRPSNTGRGYVLRRLLRRALTSLWQPDDGSLWRDGDDALTLRDLPPSLVRDTAERFGLEIDPVLVREILESEERKFGSLLRRGRDLLPRLFPSGQLTGDDYRYLHETHGLPPELVTELVSRGPGA
jgi:alanyl-tRNA synthetase